MCSTPWTAERWSEKIMKDGRIHEAFFDRTISDPRNMTLPGARQSRGTMSWIVVITKKDTEEVFYAG
jgi:hypothetical protein